MQNLMQRCRSSTVWFAVVLPITNLFRFKALGDENIACRFGPSVELCSLRCADVRQNAMFAPSAGGWLPQCMFSQVGLPKALQALQQV